MSKYDDCDDCDDLTPAEKALAKMGKMDKDAEKALKKADQRAEERSAEKLKRVSETLAEFRRVAGIETFVVEGDENGDAFVVTSEKGDVLDVFKDRDSAKHFIASNPNMKCKCSGFVRK